MCILSEDLEQRMLAACPAGIQYRSTTDEMSVTTAWCTLADKEQLLAAGSLLKANDARLMTITIFQPKAPPAPAVKEGETPPPPPTFFGGVVNDGKAYEVSYHFDVDGDVLTLTVHVPNGEEVESLTPLFRNADWPERELMEIYSIKVRNHPDPRRLFIDPRIDGAVLERLIPFSTMANSASTKGLWEKIMAQTAGSQS
jgi:NADH:ubiquinone oxidoreductase subunit C